MTHTIPGPTTGAGEPPLQLDGVTKRFGSTLALDRLDLTLTSGEVHGFLGPNGAGKTTAIRIALGMIRADGGTSTLFGGDPWRDAARLHRRVAYVPGDVNLWPNLSGGEIIRMLGRLHGGADATRVRQLTEQFDLDPTRPTRTYSKGNRQKVALIAALATDADLFILDEPTAGLDPVMEAMFREVVAGLRRDGRTILLSSHILGEVEALADRVTIIRKGRVVEAGTMTSLRHLTRTRVHAVLRAEPGQLPPVAGVHDVTVSGHTVEASVEGDDLGAFLSLLTGYGVTALTSAPPTLEELFLRHYQQDAAATPTGPVGTGG